MRLTYHPHARRELNEAARYYESCVSTLGFRFLAEADDAIVRILEAPSRWRVIEEGVRRYLMPNFPYAIYYREYADRLHILAFKHHSRHPEYWRGRVSD